MSYDIGFFGTDLDIQWPMNKSRRKREGFSLTERDLRIFQFLFEYKAATTRQIHQAFFKRARFSVVYRRLLKLYKRGFIRRKVFNLGNTMLYSFHLSEKGFKIFKINFPYRISRKELKSDSINHDMAFVDIGEKLKTFDMVEDFYTENVLSSCEDLYESYELSPFADAHSDGVFKFLKNGQEYQVAIEYEASPKWKKRYQYIFHNYHIERRIHGVFYICKDQKLKSFLEGIEKELLKDSTPNFFYCLADEFLKSKGKVTLTDSNGDELYLF